MDRGNILSGAAFRTAFYGTVALVVSLFLLGLMANVYIRDSLMADLRSEISASITSISSEYDDDGLYGLTETVTRISPVFRRTNRIALLYDTDGNRIAGELDVTPDFIGWATRAVSNPGSHDEGGLQDYYMAAVRIGDHTLIVGRDLQIVSRVESAMARALLGFGGVMTLVTVAIGYTLSRRTQTKLDCVSRTLEEVALGNMEARADVSQANDQIDRIATVMNRHLDTLCQLMTASKTSAASIAHDLKRPLSRALLGLDRAEALSENGDDPNPMLAACRTELSNLTVTFETILRIAGIDTADQPPLSEMVDLPPLLRDLAETYAVVAEESGQSLKTNLPSSDHLCVTGDAGMIIQLVVNLLQNAVSHGPDGNLITLSLRSDGAAAVITVSDTGPGIRPEDREKVLTAFFRCDAARATEGNGLGLALVKSIAERHGARLLLSDNAPGLRISVAFPAIPGA